ncbi:hypothetical protein [Undibacterium fentianense]|uniref:Uncharacterized protein n=1 Tax=Undibacterium fentianense TaxID=2828728 RepID=A0A941IFB8_9BURK|nr:hypothetical protein [Undibacterium fentianense]MBR7800551.1 hypothetical protein [Undibacterium fentianense]
MTQDISSAIQAVASVVTAIIALVALKQVSLLRTQIKTDHERSRRHRAVEDLRDWNNHLTENITSTRRLVETFSDEQLEALKENKGIKLSKQYRAIADVALGIAPEDVLLEDGDFYLLSPEHAIRLRNHCIRHLNAFEITLAAWRHGIADNHIIEEQLSYLVDLKRGWKMLEKFRKQVVGLDAHPATEMFVQLISEKKGAIELEKQLFEESSKPQGLPKIV